LLLRGSNVRYWRYSPEEWVPLRLHVQTLRSNRNIVLIKSVITERSIMPKFLTNLALHIRVTATKVPATATTTTVKTPATATTGVMW